MAVGDVNLDGDPDLVVAHRSGNQEKAARRPRWQLRRLTNFPTGTLPASVAVADFNADSKPDLTTTHPTTHNVSVPLNTTVTNRAPTANLDAYSTTEDTLPDVAAPGVLANDSDPEHDPLSAVLVSGPSHGTSPSTPTAPSPTPRHQPHRQRRVHLPGQRRHPHIRAGHRRTPTVTVNDTCNAGRNGRRRYLRQGRPPARSP